ncbi:Tn3 family transposase [Paraglaciecola sp. Hal342]
MVRTMFSLEYITDVDLRKTIQAATCKSEEFNVVCPVVVFCY